MSNKKAIIVMGVVLLLLAVLSVIMVISNKIPKNDPHAVGNSAGNLYNSGLFCEDDGIVYFSNPYDNGAVYKMNPDESGMKKILQYNVKYINAEGKYLYYYQTEQNDAVVMGFAGHTMGIYRCTKNGRKVVCLDRVASGTANLIGDYIYYQHYSNANKEGMTLYKVKTDKSYIGQVADYIIDPSNVSDGAIYFPSTKKNHNLNVLDTNTDSIGTYVEGYYWNPINKNGFVYYMNVDDDYKLYRYNLSSGENERLSEDRVDAYNISDDYIFYQSNGDEAAMKRMNLDGSNVAILKMGVHNNINITSQYVYFTQYDSPLPVYKTSINGLSVTEFEEARKSAEENLK